MRGLLSYDGFLCRTLAKITDCMCLSILWIIGCIPLVTVGASTTALYYTVNKVIRHGKPGIWREYWHSFRLNFKQATVIWIILLLVYGLLITSYYSAYLLYLEDQFSQIMLIFLLVLITVVTMWANYLLPYLARFNNTTKQLMKNCAWFAVLNFPWTVLLLLLCAVTVASSLLMPLGFVLMPAGGMLISSYILEHVFKKYMSLEDQTAENERNGVTIDGN